MRPTRGRECAFALHKLKNTARAAARNRALRSVTYANAPTLPSVAAMSPNEAAEAPTTMMVPPTARAPIALFERPLRPAIPAPPLESASYSSPFCALPPCCFSNFASCCGVVSNAIMVVCAHGIDAAVESAMTCPMISGESCSQPFDVRISSRCFKNTRSTGTFPAGCTGVLTEYGAPVARVPLSSTWAGKIAFWYLPERMIGAPRNRSGIGNG